MKDIEVVVNVLCFGSEYMPHDKNNYIIRFTAGGLEIPRTLRAILSVPKPIFVYQSTDIP